MIPPAETQYASRAEIVRLIAVILPSRVILNTAYRMGYAFLPPISRGLGVDLQTMSTLMTVRSSMGLFAPVFGPLSDRFGRRVVMVSGLLLFVLCAFVAWLSPSLLPFAVGFIGLALAKVIFDPSALAQLADRVPYERRGLVLGINELGWAGAGFLGVPLMAQAIDRWGWQSPFLIIAICGAGVLTWVFVGLSGMESRHHTFRTDYRAAFAAIARQPGALVMLCVMSAFMLGAEMIGVTYAAWLERAFQVDVLTIGGIVAAFAVADVIGELLSMWGVDRFGKKRALLAGFVAVTLAYFTIPLFAVSLSAAVAGLFVYYICFEFTIVSVFPLMSELVPEARATLLALTSTAGFIGRMAGALVGAFIFARFDFGMNGIVAGALVGIAVVALAWGVHERRQ